MIMGFVAMNKALIYVMILLIALPISYAVSPQFYKGFAFVDGAIASNGTIVEVFINNASTPASGVTIGQGILTDVTPQGRYVISFEANSGDNVTFKVNGAPLASMNGTNTSAQTITAGQIIVENFNLSVNKSADGASCTYAAGCSGGFCNSNVCASSAPSTTTTTTTSGGGGGGGGGAAVAQQTVTIPVVATNTPVTATFSDQTLGVQSIELTSLAAALNAAVTVKESSRPALAPSPVSATGFVYKYLDITSTLSTSISSAKIKFSITKAWVTANNIDVNTITLSRLVNNVWVKLPAAKISETSTLINFEATSLGLSIFVITGEKVGAPAPTAVCGNEICEAGETASNCIQDCPSAPTAVCGNNVCEAGETAANCRQDCPTAPPQPPIELPKIEPTPTNIFYAVVILIIFVIGGIWHYRKRPAKQA